MDTLKPLGLWLVTLDMQSMHPGTIEGTWFELRYQATRTVTGLDPDGASSAALALEEARQLGEKHKVLGVHKVRRVLKGVQP